MATQVSDFLYSYKDQDSPYFQEYISGKYEFAQLASDMREPIPVRGQKFKHQELILRFMKIYDKCLIIHDTGTGKTCTTLGVGQSFKHETLNAAIEYTNTYINGQPGNIDKVVIFTKSRTLENEFKHQLVCKCTEYEEYEAKISHTRQGKGSKKALTTRLRSFFTFEHYRSFNNKMSRHNQDKLDDIIRATYENTLFILDEVQDLITNDDRKEKDKNENKSTYDLLWRVFHVCKNIKVMLNSATPMIDSCQEIIRVMNLILPANNQMPLELDMKTVDYETVKPYYSGRISYVRALDTGAIPTYIGDQLPPYNIKVYKTAMNEQTIHGHVASQLMHVKDAYRSKARQAGLFVFPDGSIGKDGMMKYFESDDKSKYKWRDNVEPSLSAAIGYDRSTMINNIYQFSPKYWNALNMLEQYTDGSHFMYFNFVKVGTNLFGILLEKLGYERYNPTTSSFNKIQVGGKLKFCSDDTISGTTTSLQPGKRFAIITSKTKNPELILELMNSPINKHGEYIRVLLVSEVAKTGINVANIKYGHLMDPAWNQSTAYQALSRFIRSDSHVELIRSELEKGVENPTVPIYVFQHCLSWNDGRETVDESLYKLCVEKDIDIKRNFRFCKRSAIDCQIHKRRNVRDTDEDYSPICDYDTCNYVCSDPEPAEFDYTSYNAIYSRDEVDKIEEEIGNVFRGTSFIKYDALIHHLMSVFNHDEKEMKMLTDRAIRHLVEERKVLRDKYNFACYIREDKDNLFIQREYPSGTNDSSIALYSNRLIGVKTKTVDNIMKNKMSIIDQSILTRIKDIAATGRLPDMILYCYDLNYDLQVSILEHYLKLYGDDNRDPDTVMIVKTYYFNIFWFQEPVDLLESQRLSITSRKLKEATLAGKKVSKKKTVATNFGQFGDIVYVHNLSPDTGVLYSETASTKSKERLRLMTSYERFWRDADVFELDFYSEEISRVRTIRKDAFSNYPVFGSYSIRNKVFRLILNYLNIGGTDKRKVYRGTVCNTVSSKKTVVDIANNLNIIIPITDITPYDKKLQFIIEKGYDPNTTPGNVDRIYEMIKPGTQYKTKTICDLILDSMLDKNMIYYEF